MRWLQVFGFDKSRYERPNQKWVCGRARDGHCCLAGPDAQGNCTATTECRPLRKGDRWQCTRPAFLGGPCAEGPLPDGQCCRTIPKCVPIRSLRSWRGITVLLVTGITLAIVLIALGTHRGKRVFSPGELSFAHRSVGDNCSACHAGLSGRPAEWLAATVGTHSAHDNSTLCLNCHYIGEAPLRPHSLAAPDLQPLTMASLKKNGRGAPPLTLAAASFIPNTSHSGQGEIPCATCHKEHRGKEADLKKLSNDQCQNCHATQFVNLANGHPQFSTYPFERRTRIIFDHESHLREHFKNSAVEKFAPNSCLDCHQTDLRGGTMLVKSYESACSSCHDDQIKAKSAAKTGIPFIGIPRMDDRALTGDFSIGEWPEDADQPMTPFLRLILSGEPQLREAMDKLQGVDLSNLPKTDPEKLKAAQTLAWGIKSLIFELGLQGQDELIRRINLASGKTLDDWGKEGVVALLNADVLRTAFRPAFPNLQKELLEYRKSAKPAPTQLVPSPELAAPGPVKAAPSDTWVSQGGWYNPDGSFALYYHPRGHRDRFLSSWMDLTVNADHAADPAISRALFKELSAPKAVGLCSKCHSIDDAPVKQVNWVGSRPDPVKHDFNRFSHSAHLSLLDERGCFTCHSMKATGGQTNDTYLSAFEPEKHNPAEFHSNFKTVDKLVCANCHQPNLVRDDCLLCHNYHVGRFKPVIPHGKIATLPQPTSN